MSPDLLARIPKTCETLALTLPPGRRPGRRLNPLLDGEAQTIQDGRDPYRPFARYASLFAAQRASMSQKTREAAERRLDELYRAWGNRAADGSPTQPSYPLTFYEAARCDDIQAKRNRGLVQRRIKRGHLCDVDNPPPSSRLREFLAALRATRTPATPVQHAVETLGREVAHAARWARTVARQQQDAPAQGERRRRAAEQDGPAQLVMGTPPSPATDPAEDGASHPSWTTARRAP